MSRHIVHLVGARPNFVKAAPVIAALAGWSGARQILVHTGQHYDANMSDVFFRQLGLPAPDVNLGVGSGSQAVQTAQIMIRLEELLTTAQPDLLLVYGDVNSTVAGALVAAKLLIPVGHVEAGLRSGDRTMPEEINRLVTDRLTDLFFTPSADADQNLLQEGVAPEKIFLVGNVMIDSLVRLLPLARERPTPAPPYGLVTLHRPSNVDQPERLRELLACLGEIARDLPLIFPVHPRTQQRLADLGLSRAIPGLELVAPTDYLTFLGWQARAAAVITDSGGIQEETTFLGVPCLTLRENTERPITVIQGTNQLLGHDLAGLQGEVGRILGGQGKKGGVPPLWDGRAGERIREVLESWWPGIGS